MKFRHILLLALVCLVGPALASTPMPADHEHAMRQIPEGSTLPSLSLALHRDTKSGFNLAIQTKDFYLEPPELASDNQGLILEGHAHIFINGEKIYRAYSQHIHLPAELFDEGINQIMVSLNDHEHNTWSKGSRMVMSTLVIDNGEQDYLKHQFSTFE
ncbi:hypothetical protein QWI17_16440 [Gilvimarinus sp. SDUM040013]|uniref:Beta-galactosidase n=1 Tax=Gilvimarinus gilvus TaxID=3058038 RepID=A0ABU4S3N2_9GAMM|nr:hypothetical protein [Gilvimarinus sp. SDUM040013]MDO3387432.1 hypothetical protein [Gilvimarinus sp. SDUM040013]MDX6849909.1 hypothetical protein [Gilvimarinus sp. SDUM040013]